jgi:hypothetical protein
MPRTTVATQTPMAALTPGVRELEVDELEALEMAVEVGTGKEMGEELSNWGGKGSGVGRPVAVRRTVGRVVRVEEEAILVRGFF